MSPPSKGAYDHLRAPSLGHLGCTRGPQLRLHRGEPACCSLQLLQWRASGTAARRCQRGVVKRIHTGCQLADAPCRCAGTLTSGCPSKDRLNIA